MLVNIKHLLAHAVITTLFIVVFLEIILLKTSKTYNVIVRKNAQTMSMYLALFASVLLANVLFQYVY